ncbi:MAG: hypothetical protein L0220_12000 [Acidobacteria bacterium]|nr:hypothetical protein [Acidobacteriota bacterium]
MTTVEKIYQEAIALPPDDLRRLLDMLSKVEAPQQPMSDEELMLELKNAGLISKLPASPSKRRKRHLSSLINVTGKPLSETIIEERQF